MSLLFTTLPPEIIQVISEFLSLKDIIALFSTCKASRSLQLTRYRQETVSIKALRSLDMLKFQNIVIKVIDYNETDLKKYREFIKSQGQFNTLGLMIEKTLSSELFITPLEAKEIKMFSISIKGEKLLDLTKLGAKNIYINDPMRISDMKVYLPPEGFETLSLIMENSRVTVQNPRNLTYSIGIEDEHQKKSLSCMSGILDEPCYIESFVYTSRSPCKNGCLVIVFGRGGDIKNIDIQSVFSSLKIYTWRAMNIEKFRIRVFGKNPCYITFYPNDFTTVIDHLIVDIEEVGVGHSIVILSDLLTIKKLTLNTKEKFKKVSFHGSRGARKGVLLGTEDSSSRVTFTKTIETNKELDCQEIGLDIINVIKINK